MDNEFWLAMIDLLRGYQKTQIGCAVASLSIADHLAARPLSLEALVEKTESEIRTDYVGSCAERRRSVLFEPNPTTCSHRPPCSKRFAATRRLRCVRSPSCRAAPTTGDPGDASLML